MAERLSWILDDLGQYAHVWRESRTRMVPGEGRDYAAERDRVRRTVEAIHPRRMSLRVDEVIRETASARTLRMARLDGPLPPFRAGQYVNLFLELEGVHTSRPYSISSAPGAARLDLTVRTKPDGFVSPHLATRVEEGDEFETTGPAGTFHHEPLIDGEELVFIAGGSGITPFASMIRQAAADGWPRHITLLYGSRHPQDVIFGDELRRLARGNPRFRLALVMSEPPRSFRGRRGLLDTARIRREVGDVAGKTFFLCGPNAMVDLCRGALEELSVPEFKVRQELYGPPEDVTRVPGWPGDVTAGQRFTVRVGQQVFEAAAGEPLLVSLERAGVVVPAVCRSGECSACRMKRVRGEVFVPPNTGVRESDMALGYIHPCVTYPLSDLELRL
jgi:glycine betaine catabolism B